MASEVGNTVSINVGDLGIGSAVVIQVAPSPSDTQSQPAMNSLIIGRAPQSQENLQEGAGTSGPSSRLGRHPLEVSLEAILELREMNYKWSKIADILNISRSTLYRRLKEGGIHHSMRSTQITEPELDNLLCNIKEDHPHDGEVLIQGHLVTRGIKVSRQRLREAIHRVDHERVVARRLTVVRRRVYFAPHPNYMWHMDSHHKLIRWRLVIHGAVDGFSRTIVYLKCEDNNHSSTVLSCFRDGVTNFGMPEV